MPRPVFGMTHGLIFIGFVLTGLLVGMAAKWSAAGWLLALLASIVPLCSVIFLSWPDRTGRIGVSSASVADLQPARSVSETT